MVKALTLRHIGIVVSDLHKSIKIYTEFLGCKIVCKNTNLSGKYYDDLVGIKDVIMDIAILKTLDNNRIELLEYKNFSGKKRNPVLSNDIGASHFAITIDDLDSIYESRNMYDVKFISKPLFSPDNFVKVAYVKIMDENIVELVEVFDEKAKYSGGSI